MIKFGKWVVKHRIIILIVSVLLLIPSVFGYINTRVNYDILSYLPSDIDTMIGQDVLLENFGKGGFSMVMVDGMTEKEIVETKAEIEKVDGVDSVIWYDTLVDISVPMEVLPDEVYDFFNSSDGDSTLMVVFFSNSTSDDQTLQAISDIRSIADGQCFVSGMSAVVQDIKELSNEESVMYVVIAVVLVSIILAVTMESFLIPVFFMLSIGMAIIYNLGTNFIQGEISFITQALAAVLQLGVTMDYSIFLYHSYKEKQLKYEGDKERAMAHAISNTFTSVVGSSITTIAGFLAMCFMSFTLGLDLGIVMAKGVVFGVICCVTVLPSMILTFDRAIEKTTHKDIMPKFDKFAGFIVKRRLVFFILFLVLLVPAYYGQSHYDVYYNLDSTLPKDLQSIVANAKLSEEYNMNSTHMLLVKSDMESKTVRKMVDEMQEVDGVTFVLGMDEVIGPAIPEEVIPEDLESILKSGGYQLMLVGSDYAVASDEVNNQISELNDIVAEYDEDGMLIGEAPATKDLIDVTDRDFKVVNTVSIAAIFIIIACVLKSVSLPIILVSAIEFAIFINMGIPFYTGTTLPFIASIVIGTIQLGSTVDYAILMTTRYKKERYNGKDKKEAVTIALSTSVKSVIVSALGFFAATIGVAAYSSIDMISSLCTLMARGALVSMATVLTVLPSLLMLLDKLICATTMGIKPKYFKIPEKDYSKQSENKAHKNEMAESK